MIQGFVLLVNLVSLGLLGVLGLLTSLFNLPFSLFLLKRPVHKGFSTGGLWLTPPVNLPSNLILNGRLLIETVQVTLA